MKRRQCNDGVVYVTDRDTYIRVLDTGRKMQMRLKPTDEALACLWSGNVGYFKNKIDEAVTAGIKRKEMAEKNRDELLRIQKAAARGIPTESKVVQLRPDAPPVRVFRIVPWYRRLWAFVVRPFLPRVAVAKLDGGK